ncbi:uncharacterized protein LOC132199396 [Neocloeon triangulifer]|uniref:uncharacterized protein LOC132199396 n=1 Tax=Neocloeon triangulifer TaxID=2078957 RepID=UPI00286F080E|nr:uncharacterized protein LOC132199396 [Neocloeon triangulifer]
MELKSYKEVCARVKNDLREARNRLVMAANKICTLNDEKALLAKENEQLKTNLEWANQETSRVRHEKNILQDKIQALNVSQQNLQLQMQNLQGQYSKELNSLNRQLTATKEQVNAYKIRSAGSCHDCPMTEVELRRDLALLQRRYDELKKVFNMQQVNATSVRFRSRSSVRGSVRGDLPEDETKGVSDFVR